MIKIFKYELRRLIFNKYFAGLLIITMFYCWMTLTSGIVKGISYTAPFSPWSFGTYLARVVPFICIGELLFLTFFTSRRERRASVITSVTPVNMRKYMLVRCGAILVCVLIVVLFVLTLAFGFYAHLFGWTGFGSLAIPALIALVPPIVFFLGAGWLIGRVHPALVYVLMGVSFILPNLPFSWDIAAGSFFVRYPLSLGVTDPGFTVPAVVLCVCAVYTLAGIAMLICSSTQLVTQGAPKRMIF